MAVYNGSTKRWDFSADENRELNYWRNAQLLTRLHKKPVSTLPSYLSEYATKPMPVNYPKYSANIYPNGNDPLLPNNSMIGKVPSTPSNPFARFGTPVKTSVTNGNTKPIIGRPPTPITTTVKPAVIGIPNPLPMRSFTAKPSTKLDRWAMRGFIMLR